MRTVRDAKAMAKTLRQELAGRKINLSQSDCLEILARQFGLADWNTLVARIGRKEIATPLHLPHGWVVSGSRAEDYDMGIDESEPVGTALIRCKYAADDVSFANKANGFGTLLQTFFADAYRGKRIMLTANLRTDDVDGAATIWMRIDGTQGALLNFDNMETRTSDGVLRGTKNWTARRIVLDVAENAETVNFGFYLRGTGSAWARDFELKKVGDDVAVTAGSKPERSMPVNLDFSKRSASGS